MYEMADYFDVPELRDLCQNAIMACITPDNVLDELADDFACLHKPISEALQQYAISNWVGCFRIHSDRRVC